MCIFLLRGYNRVIPIYLIWYYLVIKKKEKIKELFLRKYQMSIEMIYEILNKPIATKLKLKPMSQIDKLYSI